MGLGSQVTDRAVPVGPLLLQILAERLEPLLLLAASPATDPCHPSRMLPPLGKNMDVLAPAPECMIPAEPGGVDNAIG
jgi:hypothetical protein